MLNKKQFALAIGIVLASGSSIVVADNWEELNNPSSTPASVVDDVKKTVSDTIYGEGVDAPDNRFLGASSLGDGVTTVVDEGFKTVTQQSLIDAEQAIQTNASSIDVEKARVTANRKVLTTLTTWDGTDASATSLSSTSGMQVKLASATEGGSCSPEGSVATGTGGELLTCQGGSWASVGGEKSITGGVFWTGYGSFSATTPSPPSCPPGSYSTGRIGVIEGSYSDNTDGEEAARAECRYLN